MVVALAFIVLAGVMFWKAVDNNFAVIWAGVGSVVGVVTGAIPTYFFWREAKKSYLRVEAIAAEATSAEVDAARAKSPDIFR